MDKLYALYPGTVISSTDGDIHYINGMQLAHLYGVPLEQCMVVLSDYYRDPSMRAYLARADKLIPLVPRYDGKYTLPSS